MIRKVMKTTNSKVIFGGLGIFAVGAALAGCGGNTADTSTPPVAPPAPTTVPATPP